MIYKELFTLNFPNLTIKVDQNIHIPKCGWINTHDGIQGYDMSFDFDLKESKVLWDSFFDRSGLLTTEIRDQIDRHIDRLFKLKAFW